ncbi:GNAT family N-acetyltransferase [Massilia cavernae]|nr:GNAT family N-acetyltransferase [Massilia cavernae]
MGIEIRPAVPADAVAVCTVLRRSITESCVEDHQNCPERLASWLGNKTPQTVAAWFTTPSNFTIVAVREGQVVGVALLTQAGKLSLCYVLPEAMRTGVGKALLDAVETQARAWDIGKLQLKSTITARDFYARNGYTFAGKEKACYGLECDFFWKDLSQAGADAGGGSRKRFCNCSGQ